MFVYELANELDVSTVELFSKLKDLNIDVNLPNPKLTQEQVEKVRSIYKGTKFRSFLKK
ncbi:MAG: translation initiation factor IF-2 N-terminal domain-containing protein [Candidatus Actinomarina sp.]